MNGHEHLMWDIFMKTVKFVSERVQIYLLIYLLIKFAATSLKDIFDLF